MQSQVFSRRKPNMMMRSDLADLITWSHQDTWATFEWVRSHASRYGFSPTKTAKWQTPGEPAFVSNLLEFPFARNRLGRVIEKHLGPVGLSKTDALVSGVFIHQKPKVKFRPYRGQVELGDLVLVRQHFSSGVAAPQGRAFLVQAKSCNAPKISTLSGKEGQQFALYSDWSTPFSFPNNELGSPPDGSKQWNFSFGPGQHADSGVYGIVANTPYVPGGFPDGCPWGVGFATSPAPGGTPSVDASTWSLVDVMEGFLLGSWGRPWDAAPPTSDHWSSFVIECLRAASTWRPYPVQRTGHTTANALPRRRDVTALVYAMAAASIGTVRPRYPMSYYRLREHYEYEVSMQMSRAAALMDAWTRSLGDGEKGGNDVPGDEGGPVDRPARGFSVLYVATFGDDRLRDPERKQAGDMPQGPNAGAW
jgi:hypothetical protein